MTKFLTVLLSCAILVGCCTPQPVVPSPSRIPETSLVKCDPLPTYTEYENGEALLKNDIHYTIHLMNIYTDCATSKDNLIGDVRASQPVPK